MVPGTGGPELQQGKQPHRVKDTYLGKPKVLRLQARSTHDQGRGWAIWGSGGAIQSQRRVPQVR